MKIFGAQHQVFTNVVQDYSRVQPAVGKFIDPDSNVLRAVKQVSPNTKTVVRIYTGQSNIADAVRFSNPEQYGYDYATQIYSRVQDPAHMDYLETENEPVDNYGNLTEFIKRLNAFLVGFSRRARELGFRPLGPNFSTGYPECFVPGSDYEIWPNAWQGLVDGLRSLRDAGGAMGIHEYDAPNLLRMWSPVRQRGYLVGRCKAIYECLPADLQAFECILTEFGIDFLVSGIQGGFWHNRDSSDESTAPAWMVQQMRDAWTQVYSTMPQLKGICFFLSGRNSPMWEEYDIMRNANSERTFYDFFGQELSGGIIPQPPVGKVPFAGGYTITQHFGEHPEEYAQYNLAGHEGVDLIPNNADWNIHAVEDGEIVRNAYSSAYGNHIVALNRAERYALWYCHLNQPSPKAVGLSVKRGDIIGIMGTTGNSTGPHLHLGERLCDEFGNAINMDNGYQGFINPEPLLDGGMIPPPPQGEKYSVQPYAFPSALTAIGAVGEEGHVVAEQPFYRLTGASVRQGISAFMVVTVIGKNGIPVVGGKVVNLFPDGNGEVIQTDGSGVARFQFGASSAFTNPGEGPFTIFIADDSAFKDSDSVPKKVVFKAKLSDIVHSLGDFQGQHTEINIQFVEQTLVDVPPDTNPGSVIRQFPANTPVADAVRAWGWSALNRSSNPSAALQIAANPTSAVPENLGKPETDEDRITIGIIGNGGVKYAVQGFANGLIYAPESNFGDTHRIHW